MFRRSILALAAVGLGLAGPQGANASWEQCPAGTHLAYNPLTGGSIRIGHAEAFAAAPDRPLWIWVCADDGGLLGATSLGTATYVSQSGHTGVLQHTVACPATSGCTQSWTGVNLVPHGPGDYGVRPCVSPVTAQYALCVSLGVTPAGLPQVLTLENPNTANGELCGVNVAGTCAVQKATVRTGGTLTTVYVDGAPVTVGLPAVCVGTNRPGTLVTVAPGSSC